MAASMRIKITDVRLDNDHLRNYVDPFWLLVSKEQHPFISDIGKRILLTCDATPKLFQNVKDYEFESASPSADADGPSSSPSSVSASPTTNASCQLWLDGCRLPDTERTDILRDNDSIVVKIITQNESKDARALSRSLDVLEGAAGNDVSLECDSHKRKRSKSDLDSESLPLDDSMCERKKKKRKKDKECVEEVKKKKKRKTNVSCNEELTTQSFKNDSVHNVSKSADTSGKKEKSKSDHKSSLKNSGLESEYNSKSDSVCVKKKKKKEKHFSGEKKSQPSMDTSCDSISKSLACEMSVDHDQVDAIQNVSSSVTSISEIERQKRKLLGKLDNFVESGKIHCDKQISEVKPTSPKDEMIADISVEPRKRRRRKQKKKPRDKDGDKTVIRVDDKPKSSVLNLPQSMRPQNCKITFNSESDEPTEEMEVNNVNERPAEIDKTKAKVEVPEMKGKFSDGSEGVKKNEKVRLGSISISKKYKELSPTCRKYLMRSTGSILDSLRATSSSNTSSYSVPCDLPVTTKSAKKSSPHESVASKSAHTNLPTPTHTKSDGASKFHTPVIKSSSELFGNVGVETSKVNGDVSIGDNSQRETATTPLDKEQLIAQSTSVDCEARFIELLHRRRLSNTSCNVVTSQNGITICSRNKSPRWNPHAQSNGFADPTRDVLTNVSTITQFNGNGQLPSMSTPSSRPSGKSTVGNDNELKKVEVFPVDIGKCPVLSGNPNTGDILAYKILEMNEDYNPVVSDFKTGKVMSCENGFVALKLFGNTAPKKLNGKFELVYDDDEEQTTEPPKIDDEQVSVEIASMMDTRLVERHTDTTSG